jgi:hypothetical protein
MLSCESGQLLLRLQQSILMRTKRQAARMTQREACIQYKPGETSMRQEQLLKWCLIEYSFYLFSSILRSHHGYQTGIREIDTASGL